MARPLAPVTFALILLNVVAYGLQEANYGAMMVNFALWPPQAAPFGGAAQFAPWQIVTYAFLHGGLEHIFFNMFALYMFGPAIEGRLGTGRYLIYYFACVIGAALAQLGVMTLDNDPSPTVGASGAVFGLLLAFGMAWPRQRLLLLFPPIPMPAWLFVSLYAVMELVLGVTRSQDGVAHFAHLGGMAAGFPLLLMWRSRFRG